LYDRNSIGGGVSSARSSSSGGSGVGASVIGLFSQLMKVYYATAVDIVNTSSILRVFPASWKKQNPWIQMQVQQIFIQEHHFWM
jgi:hypothetical protein